MQLHPKFLCAIEHHHHVYLQLDSCRFISCVMNKIMLKRDWNLDMNIDGLKIYSKHIWQYLVEIIENIALSLNKNYQYLWQAIFTFDLPSKHTI